MEKITLTQKRSQSSKLLLIISAVISLLVNLAILIYTCVMGIGRVYLVSSIIFLVLDTLFVLITIGSNFRFKYSLAYMIIYVLLLAVAIGFSIIVFEIIEQTQLFTTFAQYANVAFHAVTLFAVLFTTLRASKLSNSAMKVGVAFFLLLALSVASYGGYLISFGYFGQGSSMSTRPLHFKYDANTDTYNVVSVANGTGNIVYVPATFDGKKVSKIDCGIFNASGIESIYLNYKFDEITYENTEKLDNFSNVNLKVYTNKQDFDATREFFFNNITKENSKNTLAFNRAFVPQNLDNNEVYISFTYSDVVFARTSPEYIKTWFAQKDSTFDLDEYNNLTYVDKILPTNENLHWAYNNCDKLFFEGMIGENGNVDGAKISQSVSNAVASFAPIYKVVVNEDNDSKFTVSDSFKNTVLTTGTLNYRYVTSNTANSLLDQLESREGFTLSWVDSEGNIFSELDSILTPENDIIEIAPQWTLTSPEIESVHVDHANDTIIYGDSIQISSSAKSNVTGVDVKYEWFKNGSLVGSGAILPFNVVKMTDAGEYVLKVTSYSNSVTSLTSQSEYSISFSVNKKRLPVQWIVPENLVYSGTEKQLSATFDNSILVSGDVINLEYTYEKATNVGQYTARVSLSGDIAEKYYIPEQNQNKSYEITPYSIEINWSNTSFVYNGQNQCATASVNGIGNDSGTQLALTISGEQKNASDQSYVATATTSNANYVISNPTQSFTITPKTVTLVWDKDSFVYNGQLQGAKVTEIVGCVMEEEQTLIAGITYSGRQTNVSSTPYTITASLNNSNYQFELDEHAEKEYNITKKDLAITINSINKTYDNKPLNFTFNHDGLCSTDSIEQVFVPSYTLDADTVDVGVYVIDATYSNQTKTNNYNVTLIDANAKILPCEISLITDRNSFVYNGTEQQPQVIKVNGAENVLGFNQTNFINDLVLSQPKVNAGNNYEFVATNNNSNYLLGQSNEYRENYSISKLNLSVSVYSDGKVYDGTNVIEGKYRINGNSVAPTDVVDEVLQLNYSFENMKNAGTWQITATNNGSTKTDNYNVDIQGSSYVIQPRVMTVVWSNASYIYDGTAQAPYVVEFTNVADAEISFAPSHFILEEIEGFINAGQHSVSILPVSTDYEFENDSISFNIEKASLTITFNDYSTTYNGKAVDSENFTYEYTTIYDDIGEVFVPDFAGLTFINVGEYDILPTNNEDLATKCDNYDVTIVKGVCTISPCVVTVVFNAPTNLTYDGSEKEYSVQLTCALGELLKDEDYIVDCTLLGAQVENVVEVGVYTVKITLLDNINLTLSQSEFTFEIIAPIEEGGEN